MMVRMLPPALVLKKISNPIAVRPARDRQNAKRIAWAISIAGQYIPGSKCLAQAIAGRSLLARYGFAGTIHIGVAKNPTHWLSAHAWVEVEGQAVIGGDITSYAPLIGARQESRP